MPTRHVEQSWMQDSVAQHSPDTLTLTNRFQHQSKQDADESGNHLEPYLPTVRPSFARLFDKEQIADYGLSACDKQSGRDNPTNQEKYTLPELLKDSLSSKYPICYAFPPRNISLASLTAKKYLFLKNKLPTRSGPASILGRSAGKHTGIVHARHM